MHTQLNVGSPWVRVAASLPAWGRAAASLLVGAVFLAAAPPCAASQDEPIQPIPLSLRPDPARADIGRRLFSDRRLSRNDAVSCASCHDMAKGGADGRSRSIGFAGRSTDVNAPTVLNAALNFKQFWDGRADTLESQVDLVLRSPVEMGSTWPTVIAKIAGDDAYRKAFKASYPEGISQATIQNAIASYERTLITPDSRFDRFLRGNSAALSVQEKAGYAAFKRYGCVACHQGVNVGGNMFQKFGAMRDYMAARGGRTPADLGRFAVTGVASDRFVFKVPSLRNVALTAPYFHDASAATLDDAVDVMFRYQLGRVASKDDKATIVAFLRTLTGDLGPRP